MSIKPKRLGIGYNRLGADGSQIRLAAGCDLPQRSSTGPGPRDWAWLTGRFGSELSGATARTPRELWALAARDQAHIERLDGALGRVVRAWSKFMASRDDFEQAKQRAKEREARFPRAVSAHYDRKTGRIVIHLSSKLMVSFSPCDVEGLEDA